MRDFSPIQSIEIRQRNAMSFVNIIHLFSHGRRARVFAPKARLTSAITGSHSANTPTRTSILHTLASIPISCSGSLSLSGVKTHFCHAGLRACVWGRTRRWTLWMARSWECYASVLKASDVLLLRDLPWVDVWCLIGVVVYDVMWCTHP